MKFKDHFSQVAAQYSAFRPLYPDSMFEYLSGLCPSKRLAWDCACGSGQASVTLSRYFDHVIATDASASQIASATPHSRVTYRVARAEESGLDTGSVDLVTVAQALHWLDLEAFYREATRVLHDTGVLAVWSYGNFQIEGPEVDRIVQNFYSNTVGPYWPPERELVETGYCSLEFPFDEMTPPRFEMLEQWSLEQLSGYLRSWSAVGKYADQYGKDPVTPLAEELAGIWGGSDRKRRVAWPFVLRVGRKRRSLP